MRSLRAHAGTTFFAISTLALGLGATVAIYAVVDAVLLRELPYANADRLVQVDELADDGHAMRFAYPNYADLRASLPALDAASYFAAVSGPVTSGGAIQRATTVHAGGDFFRVFGVAAELGRTFDARTRERVVVVSHALWQGMLHGRIDVLGSTLSIDGHPATIIGVMPSAFAFPEQASAWTPYTDDPGSSRSAHNWSVVARLRDAASFGEAGLAASTLAARLSRQYGDQTDAVGFDLVPLRDALAAPVRQPLLLLAAGTAFLLLIAVTNAANLLLASNASRSRELAVRSALGASGFRIARQIFLEGLLIAVAAGAAALGLAMVAIRLLVRGGEVHLPRLGEIVVGPGALMLVMVASLSIALVTTLAVLWSRRLRSTTLALRESARGQSPGRSQLALRAALLVGQTALTTALLVGVGLLGRSFLALLDIDPGYRADSAMTVQLSRPRTRDPAAALDNARRFDEVIREIRALPGVEAVGGVSSLPLDGGMNGAFWDGSVSDMRDAPKPIGYAEFRVASGDYFAAVGVPLLVGRSFDERDRADGGHVAVVSAAAARATWGDADPIGRSIQYGNMDGDMRALTVIGVVGDVHESSLDRAPSGAVYVDLDQRPLAAADFNLIVRSSLGLPVLAPSLRRLLENHAADVPYALAPLADLRSNALAERRVSLVLLAAFASIALALAVGGLYGLMAFSVGQRRHEFALRQALGANRGRVVRLVLRSGLTIGAAGVIAGLALALAGSRLATSLLYGVASTDPLTFAGVAVLLLGTILLACLLPARRASEIAPGEALR
jgi:predicted permease